MGKITESWNRGYLSGGTRTLQSMGLFIAASVLIAGLVAGGLASYAWSQNTNVVDLYQNMLSDHIFQIASGGTALALATFYIGRAVYGGAQFPRSIFASFESGEEHYWGA